MSALYFSPKQALEELTGVSNKLWDAPSKINYYAVCNARKYLDQHIKAQEIIIARLHATITRMEAEALELRPTRIAVEAPHNASDAARKTSNAGY